MTTTVTTGEGRVCVFVAVDHCTAECIGVHASKSGYGAELALLARMEGDRTTEAEIHGRFSHLRLGRTEQFRPGADLMAFIGRPPLVNPDPDAVEAAGPAREDKVIILRLPVEEHKKLRRVAADNETNMALMARKIVMDYLAAHGPKGGGK
jgi:hypothetical protein